jgi:murein DD-endopeptidase MepM/ murein hydrolase activator NlpD
VHRWPHNWWEEGCGRVSIGCEPCGVGVTLVVDDGNRWTYCHGANLTVAVGEEVEAGRQILWSGNTGRSGTPHLHIEIRTPDGQRRCPQPILIALARGDSPPAPQTTSCSF